MYFSRSPWSAVPGESTNARYGDELKVQRVAGCWEAVGIFLEDGHPEGHGDGLQTERVLQPVAGVSGVAAGLVDDLRHPVQVNVLSVEPEKEIWALIQSLLDVRCYMDELRAWYLLKEAVAPSARHVHVRRCSSVLTSNMNGTKM